MFFFFWIICQSLEWWFLIWGVRIICNTSVRDYFDDEIKVCVCFKSSTHHWDVHVYLGSIDWEFDLRCVHLSWCCDSVLEMALICYWVFPVFFCTGLAARRGCMFSALSLVLFRARQREILLIKKCGPQASCFLCLLCVLQIPTSLSKHA